MPGNTERARHEYSGLKRLVLAASGLERMGQRPLLFLGFAAVFLPLLLLMGFQYWWLADLDRASRLARDLTLDNCLEYVDDEITVYYQDLASQALYLPQTVSMWERGRVRAWFRGRFPNNRTGDPLPGVQYFFVYTFGRGDFRSPLVLRSVYP